MISEMMNFNRVGGIERGLGHFMTPIDPDPDFVSKLGSRLRHPKSVSLELQSSPRPAAMMVLMAGFILGILSVVLLRRLR